MARLGASSSWPSRAVLLWALLAWELGACVGLSRLLPSLHSTRAPRCAPRCAAFLASSDDDLYTDDPYKLLQVERGASAEEIRQAFRTRAKGVHPDVSSQPNAAHSFLKLVRAFNRLLDEGGASTGAGASTGCAPSGARKYDGSYDTSVKQRAAERAARAWGASGRSSHGGATPHTHRTRRESEDAEREASQLRRKRWREMLFEEVCRDCMPLGSDLSAVDRAAFVRSLEGVVGEFSARAEETASRVPADDAQMVEQLHNREVIQVELEDASVRLQLHRERSRGIQEELERAERKASIWRHTSPSSEQTMARELAFLELAARLRARQGDQKEAIEQIGALQAALRERLDALPPRTV